jgi:hypothetical protein
MNLLLGRAAQSPLDLGLESALGLDVALQRVAVAQDASVGTSVQLVRFLGKGPQFPDLSQLQGYLPGALRELALRTQGLPIDLRH